MTIKLSGTHTRSQKQSALELHKWKLQNVTRKESQRHLCAHDHTQVLKHMIKRTVSTISSPILNLQLQGVVFITQIVHNIIQTYFS